MLVNRETSPVRIKTGDPKNGGICKNKEFVQLYKYRTSYLEEFWKYIFLYELLVAMAMEKFPYIFKKFVKSS